MAYVFFGFIFIFFVTSLWYLISNSFSHETLAVLFPAIGAILLSGYLGFKSIYLDAPKSKTFGTMTVIFHDYNKGQIKSLVPFGELKYTTRLNFGVDFRGSYLFDTLQNDSVFKELNISEILQNNPIDGDGDISSVMIGHFIEYAILKWMCYPEMRTDYFQYYKTEGIINTLGSSGASIGRDLTETPMVFSENELNPLMKAKPLKMDLPKGSKIVRYIDDLPLKFEIVTRHSRIQVICAFSDSDQLGIPFHKDAKRFYEILNWPTNIQDQGLFAWGIDINFTVSQFPFKRFSHQAKLEAQWLNRLPEQLEKGFSWSKLEDIYMQD